MGSDEDTRADEQATITNLRNALREAGAEMDRRYELGQRTERGRIAALAEKHGVHYLHIEPVVSGSSYMPGCSARPFADLIHMETAGSPYREDFAPSEARACRVCGDSEFVLRPDGAIICEDDDCHAVFGRWVIG